MPSLPFTLLLAAALAGLGGAARGAPPPPSHVAGVPDEPRPVLLVVHGRGQLGRDTATLRREAHHALARGISRVRPGFVLAEDDVRLVWYADVLARPEAARCDRPAQASFGADAVSMMALLAGALLDGVAVDGTSVDGAELRRFAGDLRYVGDAVSRCAAEGRVAEALARAAAEQRPVILVAHSLGGLVAWGHLSRREPAAELPTIRRLVTVGSLVGAPDVRRLVFGAREGERRLPPFVGSWVNVVDGDDPFAARVLGAQGDVTEVSAEERDGDPHELTGYLRDPATARAVLGAWTAGGADPRR